MTKFYDSSDVSHFPPGVTHAAFYRDGRFAVPAGTLPGVERRWITVLGGADAARTTGICDFERGNAAYIGTNLRDWAAERHAMGKRARVYCNRADAARALAEVRGLPAIWWIATLDGREWTAAELVADLRANWHADIALGDMWGNQFTDRQNLYDVSNLFGVW